jgi:uncharacterized protein (TIGR02466 family)
MTSDPVWAMEGNILFPTPIFSFKLQDYQALNQQLLEVIYQLKETEKSAMRTSAPLGWQSQTSLFDLPQCQSFKHLIDAAVLETAKAIGYGEVKMQSERCWANVNPKYASNTVHDHANCLFSGVYYVQTPPNSGNLTFHDPRQARVFMQPRVSGYTPYIADSIDVEVQEGVIMIFPSWLKHGVETNLSGRDRVSLSFNYVFVRPI